MISFIKKNTIYIYIGLFLIISYLSIYQAKNYLPSNLLLHYKQLIWYMIGIFLIMIINKIGIKKINKYCVYLYILNVLLLFGLFFFGTRINNSKAWYLINGISFQPSEFMKINIILVDAFLINRFYKKKEKITSKEEIKLLFLLFIVLLIPSILTFLEPDTGSIIGYLIITLASIYYSNINKKWLNIMFFTLLLFIIIFLYLYFNYQDFFIDIFGNSFFYRIDRLINWQSKSGIQLNNSLIAIGSSGFFGNSIIPIYYPELETDFIFTSFSSSYGFFGGLLLILLVFSFDIYILNSIKKIPNKQNRIIIFSITCLFIYQHIQSIGMTMGILPITGITLPLISYGGSSIITYLILIGIIINIKEKV